MFLSPAKVTPILFNLHPNLHLFDMFYVFQSTTDTDGNVEITNLYEVRDEQVASDEVDRINSGLQLAGIPSSVSCAYYQ